MTVKRVRIRAPDGTWVETDCTVLPPGEASGCDTWTWGMDGPIRSLLRRRYAETGDTWRAIDDVDEDVGRRAHYEDHGTLLTDDEREQYEAGVDCLAFMEPE